MAVNNATADNSITTSVLSSGGGGWSDRLNGVGKSLDTSDPVAMFNYNSVFKQAFLEFVAPSTGGPRFSIATLSFRLASTASLSGRGSYEVVILPFDHGGSITTADYRTGSQAAAISKAFTSQIINNSDAAQTFQVTHLNPNSITPGSTLRFVLLSQIFADNNPADSEGNPDNWSLSLSGTYVPQMSFTWVDDEGAAGMFGALF